MYELFKADLRHKFAIWTQILLLKAEESLL